MTRQRTLVEPTDLTEPIWRAALELSRPETRGKRIRLVGISASGFGEREQLGLFEPDDPRQRRATEAADELRRRYGPRAVTRARLLRTGLPAPFERDHGTAAERRGEHAADLERSGRKRRATPAATAGDVPGAATNSADDIDPDPGEMVDPASSGDDSST